jgi:hypothetical protein
MWNLLATAIIGFLAGLVCYLVGKSGHKTIMWFAGGLAFVVGWGLNIWAYVDVPRVTETYTHCIPRMPPATPFCTDYELPTNEPQPEREPFIISSLKGLGTNMLEAPAAAVGILMAIGIAKLSGVKGPAPPLHFIEGDDTSNDS